MKKQIKIVPYDPNWPKQFQQVADSLNEILGDHCLEVHHIGSTAVPELSAKPKIDVLCIVDELNHSLALQNHGYEFKGELNIPLRYFFSYRSSDLQVNLHVVEKDHSFIPLNLTFRDYLRKNEKARMEYGALKNELQKDPSSYARVEYGLPIYTLRKDALIKRFLEQAGYQGLGLRFCAHFREWEEYHRILKIEVEKRPNYYHFVLYLGTQIIGAAHVDLECTLQQIVIDAPFQGKGYDDEMKKMIEKWLGRKRASQ